MLLATVDLTKTVSSLVVLTQVLDCTSPLPIEKAPPAAEVVPALSDRFFPYESSVFLVSALLRQPYYLKPSNKDKKRRTENRSYLRLTFSCSLCSPATVSTSCTYSGNPSSRSALSTCSVAIVFLASFSAISLASDEMRVMNSTQQSMRRSRASFAKVVPGLEARISVMIFWTVALGRERSSVPVPASDNAKGLRNDRLLASKFSIGHYGVRRKGVFGIVRLRGLGMWTRRGTMGRCRSAKELWQTGT